MAQISGIQRQICAAVNEQTTTTSEFERNVSQASKAMLRQRSTTGRP